MTIKLRPYQQEAINSLKAHFQTEDAGCLVLPTGAGKTFTTWSFLKDEIAKKRKVLWIVHREYLISQAEEAARKMCPNARITKWTAHEKDSSGDIVIGMVLSTKTLAGNFHWLVYDECHRSAARSYKNLESRITFCKKLGISATPERHDQSELGLGEAPVYQIGFKQLVDLGFLAKPVVNIIRTGTAIDYTVSGGDISSTSLGEIDQTFRNIAVLGCLRPLSGKALRCRPSDMRRDLQCLDIPPAEKDTATKSLIFACNIGHVEELVSLINERYPDSAVGLHSAMSSDQREHNLRGFKEGRYDFLVNCLVFTEGFDLPEITDIILARPTISKSLWTQMVGRGARIAPGKTEFGLYILLDDVSKFSWLIKEWVLDISEEDALPEVKSRIDKKEVLERLSSNIGVSPPTVVTELDVTGLIRTVGMYDDAKEMTHVMTPERDRCLAFFEYITRHYWNKPVTSQYIDRSYGFSVTSGEFSPGEWKQLAWSWVNRYIRDIKFNKRYKSIWEESWINRTSLSNAELESMRLRIGRIMIAFNKKANEWLKNNKPASVWKEADIPQKSRWILSKIESVTIKDRVIIIRTSLEKFMPSIKGFIDAITHYMRQELDDDNLVVSLKISK